MAVIERDGLRLGTSADAGRRCVTEKKPEGIDGDLYRFYMRTQGAPGPYQVWDATLGRMVSARDEDGRELFDLGAVDVWNAGRPGSGHGSWGRADLKWSQMRHDVHAAARAEQIRLVVEKGARGRSRPHGVAGRLQPRQVQRLSELVNAGLIVSPGDETGRYRITPAGERWLEQHRLCATG